MVADETREPVDVLRIVGTREAIKRVFPWCPLRIREDTPQNRRGSRSRVILPPGERIREGAPPVDRDCSPDCEQFSRNEIETRQKQTGGSRSLPNQHRQMSTYHEGESETDPPFSYGGISPP